MSCRSHLTVPLFLSVCVGTLLPQVSTPEYTLRFSNTAPSGKTQVRYYLSGKFQRFINDEASGYLNLSPGETTARIPTRIDQQDAAGLSAFVYQPGCRVQYITVEDLKNGSGASDIPCTPVKPITLHVIVQNRVREGPPIGLAARFVYTANRIRRLQDMNDITSVEFVLGLFPILPAGSLDAQIPDFGNDPALTTLKGGEFNIEIHEAEDGHTIGWLVLPHRSSKLQHRLAVAATYPEVTRLDFSDVNLFAQSFDPASQ